MEFVKLQCACLIIVLYIAFIYYKQSTKYNKIRKISLFDGLLIVGIFSLIFDGITAYTVNNLGDIDNQLNLVLHALFLLSIDLVVFMFSLYMLDATGSFPDKYKIKIFLFLPFIINCAIVIFGINSLKFIEGVGSNYSMGLSAYTCFIMVGVYTIFSGIVFIKNWRFLEHQKRLSVTTYLIILIVITVYQSIFPESLVTSIGTTILIIGVYLNQEDPSLIELQKSHNEMVNGFATLVENRDESTGEHIQRTTEYVKLILEELVKKGYYRDILTNEYIKNMITASPLHDIGKISVPDAILKKPGRLTEEEYERVKLHTVAGGKIINETFSRIGDQEYRKIAYEVALHHHEKWNGKGYPDNLQGDGIPLCARIMAIADVFDAVSEKRCYKEAYSLDQCFEIIESGKGIDFDPLLVDIFLGMKEKVIKVYNTASLEKR